MDTRLIRVADVTRTSPHIVSGLASVQTAIEEMNHHNISSLIIERRHDGDEYGIVTVRDIAAKVIAINRSTERTSVYEIMTKPVLTLNADMNVKYALRLLARHGLSRALVIGNKELLGLVTLRDMVLSYAHIGD